MPITTKSPCLYYNSNRLAHKWLVLCFFPRKITPALPPIFSIGSVVDFYLVIFNQKNSHHHQPDFFLQRFFRSSPTIPIHLPIVSNLCFPIFFIQKEQTSIQAQITFKCNSSYPAQGYLCLTEFLSIQPNKKKSDPSAFRKYNKIRCGFSFVYVKIAHFVSTKLMLSSLRLNFNSVSIDFILQSRRKG